MQGLGSLLLNIICIEDVVVRSQNTLNMTDTFKNRAELGRQVLTIKNTITVLTE